MSYLRSQGHGLRECLRGKKAGYLTNSLCGSKTLRKHSEEQPAEPWVLQGTLDQMDQDVLVALVEHMKTDGRLGGKGGGSMCAVDEAQEE